MISLADKYLRLLQQGWIPIFVNDGRDAEVLVDACVTAGLQVIEITCRRETALDEIVQAKRRWPELIILAGSTVDNHDMVRHVNSIGTALPTIDQLVEAGADGFVSIFPFSDATIERLRHTHLLIPGVSSLSEAYQMMGKGVHVAKMVNTPPAEIGIYTSAPTHSLIPLLVTGGISKRNIDSYVKHGAAVLAGGWDIMMDGTGHAKEAYTDAVLDYVRTMHASREKINLHISSLSNIPWFSPYSKGLV